MSNESQNIGHMLLFRGTACHEGLSMEELQAAAGKMMAWFKDLQEKGIVIGGHPLEATGKIITGKGGRNVSDGPFAESKEAIGGYFMLKVDTLEEAVEIGKQCPMLVHGVQVEVRPVMAECPLMKKAGLTESFAHA